MSTDNLAPVSTGRSTYLPIRKSRSSIASGRPFVQQKQQASKRSSMYALDGERLESVKSLPCRISTTRKELEINQRNLKLANGYSREHMKEEG